MRFTVVASIDSMLMLTNFTYFLNKVQFLRDIGVQEEAIGNMLTRFPSLMTYSLYKKMRPVV